jgi:hypothetical protein
MVLVIIAAASAVIIAAGCRGWVVSAIAVALSN